MPRIEMLQAGLVWAEKELNGWAGDIEGEGEIGGSSEGVAHRLRDIAQSIRTTLEFADAAAEAEARRAEAASPGYIRQPFDDRFLLGRKEARAREVGGPKSGRKRPWRAATSVRYSRCCTAQYMLHRTIAPDLSRGCACMAVMQRSRTGRAHEAGFLYTRESCPSLQRSAALTRVPVRASNEGYNRH